MINGKKIKDLKTVKMFLFIELEVWCPFPQKIFKANFNCVLIHWVMSLFKLSGFVLAERCEVNIQNRTEYTQLVRKLPDITFKV